MDPPPAPALAEEPLMAAAGNVTEEWEEPDPAEMRHAVLAFYLVLVS